MHRVAQFVAHVRARVEPAETDDARRLLGEAAWPLFAAMPVADRRHAHDVVARLRAGGWDDPDLLTAALLHDAAKGHRMRLWHRVTGVLLETAAPNLLSRIASPDPGSWRYAYHLYLHHDRLSADLAEAAGCSARAVAFLRGSASGADDVRLAHALKVADDAS
ncbi:MAG: hypothetical protein KY392_04510 [Chloroflexi bacterium]|nr:hypothetical protein [Chloroflexota bacterium]